VNRWPSADDFGIDLMIYPRPGRPGDRAVDSSVRWQPKWLEFAEGRIQLIGIRLDQESRS